MADKKRKRQLCLIFDTETNGFIPPRRLISIAWIRFEIRDSNEHGPTNFIIDEEVHRIVKPVGYEITNSDIHGITHEQALREGDSCRNVLAHFRKACLPCDKVYAYNLPFDKSVIQCESNIQGFDPFFDRLDSECLLAMAKAKLIKHNQLDTFNLGSLYKAVIDRKGYLEHNALADCKAILTIFQKLRKLPIDFYPRFCVSEVDKFVSGRCQEATKLKFLARYQPFLAARREIEREEELNDDEDEEDEEKAKPEAKRGRNLIRKIIMEKINKTNDSNFVWMNMRTNIHCKNEFLLSGQILALDESDKRNKVCMSIVNRKGQLDMSRITITNKEKTTAMCYMKLVNAKYCLFVESNVNLKDLKIEGDLKTTTIPFDESFFGEVVSKIVRFKNDAIEEFTTTDEWDNLHYSAEYKSQLREVLLRKVQLKKQRQQQAAAAGKK